MSRGYAGLPPASNGQRIGLFGGTFNPAHEGHRAASLLALRRLKLDWIWWLVTPGNPFKDLRRLPSVGERIAAAQRIAAHPKIVVTGVESSLGSHYTFDIIKALTGRHPTLDLVLIMGADSFVDLHKWRHWSRIAAMIPIAVVDRPGFTIRATRAHAAWSLRGRQLPEAEAGRLAGRAPPTYVFLHGPRSNASSTELRREGATATTIP